MLQTLKEHSIHPIGWSINGRPITMEQKLRIDKSSIEQEDIGQKPSRRITRQDVELQVDNLPAHKLRVQNEGLIRIIGFPGRSFPHLWSFYTYVMDLLNLPTYLHGDGVP